MIDWQQFHFIRPLWLLLVVPALALTLYLWRAKSSGANWRAAIAPDLIDYLLEPGTEARRRWPLLLLGGWLLGCFALAGPTWEKLPQPVLQKRDGLVIVLDLSLSMYAEDIKPSRLQRARYKVLDILRHRREGLTGLVVYSGDAHVVTPLTDDTATIANLVPALAPAMMPSFGSAAAAGVTQAIDLLRHAGFSRGRILLISDEIADDESAAVASSINAGGWQLSILGVGTDQGAPIPLVIASSDGSAGNPNQPQRSFLKQNDGTIAIAQLHRERFAALAEKTGARYSDLRFDEADIDALLPETPPSTDDTRTVERSFDQWRERGPQFVIALLPLAALAFRRGWLLLLLLLPFSAPSQALEWKDLWQRPDQRAQQQLKSGDAKAAAEQFRDPNWRGAAQYRSGEYQQAADTLQPLDAADAQYNRGNALAHAGKLQDALAAYDAALKKNPALDDAKANRDLVAKLLEQQQQQQNSQQGDKKQDQQKNDAQQPNDGKQGDQQKDGSSQQDGKSQSGNQSSGKGDDGKSSDGNSSPQDRQQGNSGNNRSDQRNSESSEQQAARQDAERKDGGKQRPATADKPGDEARSQSDAQTERQQQATEQWLRQIPDDPAGLLRRKFLYEHRQRERSAPSDEQPTW